MRAEVVLEDCRKVLSFLEDARTEQEFRIHWVSMVTLLRVVGHVLDKVDAVSCSKLRKAVDENWQKLHAKRDENLIFWAFIEDERNSVLKEYGLRVALGDVPVVVRHDSGEEEFVLDECIFNPLTDGPYAGEDGRDVARNAIAWWENQLSLITDHSKN